MRDLIGAMLRRVRQEQGRTLREVAEAAQVSLPYLSEVERGRKEPSSEVLAAIRQALGLRLVDLVGGMHMELAAPAVVPVQGPNASLGGPAGGHRAVMLAA
ncbi:helix-turn-helix domain-containing protein [Nocardiopsis suaedae]|uniref:Helix-turn-helix transcriptional regulator n=1 Tax=Nocardiopsis suaedae TaxID=3018444 RepID=A0ABT4TVJ7_9ACTN|nr:helix-turn-helix transcriptional regulator [Nocardiopsis suaedae]MDA2808710.1 helix-turn-helix transcriptional regulator [Nocardiopsis suaedae]